MRYISLETIVTLWVAVMSLSLFIVMGLDKYFAKAGARRVPEAKLFRLALIGGALGGWIGMYTFRHKTRHAKFVIAFPALAVVQLAIVWYLCYGTIQIF